MSAKRHRRRFTAPFKAEVALAALQEREPLAALAVKFGLTPAQITTFTTTTTFGPIRDSTAKRPPASTW